MYYLYYKHITVQYYSQLHGWVSRLTLLDFWMNWTWNGTHSHVLFSSVAQSCPTLCNPMDCSTPALPVHGQLPEFTQTYVHWVSDAIQPSHPLSSPSPPAFNLSQHQGLFQWVSSFIRWPKYHSFSFSICPSNEIQDWFPSGLTGYISLQFKGHSRVFSTVQKHQLFKAQLAL